MHFSPVLQPRFTVNIPIWPNRRRHRLSTDRNGHPLKRRKVDPERSNLFERRLSLGLDRSWLKVKSPSPPRGKGGIGWCSTRFIALSSTGFPTNDAFPTIERRRSVTAIPLVRDPYPDSSYIPLYLTAPSHRDASRRGRFHADIDFLISARWNWYSSSPREYTQALESLRNYFPTWPISLSLERDSRVEDLVVTIFFFFLLAL